MTLDSTRGVNCLATLAAGSRAVAFFGASAPDFEGGFAREMRRTMGDTGIGELYSKVGVLMLRAMDTKYIESAAISTAFSCEITFKFEGTDGVAMDYVDYHGGHIMRMHNPTHPGLTFH